MLNGYVSPHSRYAPTRLPLIVKLGSMLSCSARTPGAARVGQITRSHCSRIGLIDWYMAMRTELNLASVAALSLAPRAIRSLICGVSSDSHSGSSLALDA